jgi:hypothetical protein
MEKFKDNMKKLLTFIMMCFICTLSFSQKTFSSENFIIETVDEFGDNTGKMKVGVIAQGYFSNSATTNSCAQLIISLMEIDRWYNLYEYCGNHASHDSFRIIFTGTSTHNTVTATHEIPLEFLTLCAENDTINVKMYETSSYSTTTAVFRLFECKDLYQKYITEFKISSNQ